MMGGPYFWYNACQFNVFVSCKYFFDSKDRFWEFWDMPRLVKITVKRLSSSKDLLNILGHYPCNVIQIFIQLVQILLWAAVLVLLFGFLNEIILLTGKYQTWRMRMVSLLSAFLVRTANGILFEVLPSNQTLISLGMIVHINTSNIHRILSSN